MFKGKRVINSVLIFYNVKATDWNLFPRIYRWGDLFIQKRKMHEKGIQQNSHCNWEPGEGGWGEAWAQGDRAMSMQDPDLPFCFTYIQKSYLILSHTCRKTFSFGRRDVYLVASSQGRHGWTAQISKLLHSRDETIPSSATRWFCWYWQ